MRIEVEIDFQFNMGSTAQLENVTVQPSAQSNVANPAQIISSEGAQGFKGFHFADTLGEWPATANGTYKYYKEEGYKGFLSRNLSKEDFTTDVSLNFYLRNQIPDFIFITFDNVCNEYATRMRIKNNKNSNTMIINNRSYKAMIPLKWLGTISVTDLIITIDILEWNKTFKGVKITKLSTNYIGNYTGGEIINLVCSENLLDKQLNISAGICEQYADIKLYDRDQLLRQFARQEILLEQRTVTIKAISDNEMPYILGTYYVDEWQVDSNSSEVNLICTDIFKALENIFITPLPIAMRSVDAMLQTIFGQANIAGWRYIDSTTETYCKNIKTPNSWFYIDDLLESLIKVCLLGQLRVYWHIDAFIIARCY